MLRVLEAFWCAWLRKYVAPYLKEELAADAARIEKLLKKRLLAYDFLPKMRLHSKLIQRLLRQKKRLSRRVSTLKKIQK